MTRLLPVDQRARNGAYFLLIMSWGALALPPFMLLIFLTTGQGLKDKATGHEAPAWFEILVGLVLLVVGFGLNSLARGILNRAGQWEEQLRLADSEDVDR